MAATEDMTEARDRMIDKLKDRLPATRGRSGWPCCASRSLKCGCAAR